MANLLQLCIDEFISFKWDFGGKKVFLKVIYMPQQQHAQSESNQQIHVRQFLIPMVNKGFYNFEAQLVSAILSNNIDCLYVILELENHDKAILRM